MSLAQLSRASAIYGLGWIAVFVMFGLLYRHAYRKRQELGLTPLEVFNIKSFAGHHMVSAAVGVVVVLIALAAPRNYAVFSPMVFFSHVAGAWRLWEPEGEKAESPGDAVTRRASVGSSFNFLGSPCSFFTIHGASNTHSRAIRSGPIGSAGAFLS